jgi:flagellar export protein FliJ
MAQTRIPMHSCLAPAMGILQPSHTPHHTASRLCGTKERRAVSDNQAVNGPVFRFRLERVRVLRERKEQQARQELAQAIASRANTAAELRAAEAHLEQAHSDHRARAIEVQTLNADELIARQAFLERIEAQRGAHAQELQRREAIVAERDVKLTVASSEHEMLKRLSERRRGEHERAASSREQGALDEMTAVRFGRSEI